MVKCGLLQIVSKSISDYDVGVCFTPYKVFVCLTPQSHGIQRGRYAYMVVVCDIPHQIGKKVFGTTYVWTLLLIK